MQSSSPARSPVTLALLLTRPPLAIGDSSGPHPPPANRVAEGGALRCVSVLLFAQPADQLVYVDGQDHELQ